MGIVHEKRPPKRFHWAVVSKTFQSKLFFNAYPEIYEIPDDIFLVFRLYTPNKRDFLEKKIELASLEEVQDRVSVIDIFGENSGFPSDEFCYISMFSNFGGWYMYSSMAKGRSLTIEHSF